MRWDLIDRFQSLKKGQRAVASKAFDGTEDFFAEHYPGNPRVPETLLIEMIAQAGGVLYGLGFDFEKEVILAKILEAEFPSAAAPACDLEVEALLEESREEAGLISGIVRDGSRPVASARMMLVALPQLPGTQRDGKIVFSESFLKHYDVYNVARLTEAGGCA